jgi:Uma2 family endonuclease
MAAAGLVSLDEYLHTVYEPECEYVDGALIERNAGAWNHGEMIGVLVAYLAKNKRKWNVHVLPILRIRVTPTCVRVPDVSVFPRGGQIEQIPSHPPLVWIEILDSEDDWAALQTKFHDVFAMGVAHVWVFDPEERQVFDCTREGRRLVSEETLVAPPVSINLRELFAELDS